MVSSFCQPLLKAFTVIAVAAVSVAASGSTIVLNGITYYASPDVVATIGATPAQLKQAGTDDWVPLTVMDNPTGAFTTTVLQDVIKSYTAADDVFSSSFLQAIYLKYNSTASTNTVAPLDSVFSQYGTKVFFEEASTGCSTPIPAGPYFLSTSTGDVVQAYRVYSDVQGAFTQGLISKTDGTFDVFPATVQGAQSQSIGVLSRLYYTKTADKPLAGVRLGVKDIYDIAGVKTSCGNRAFYELYPEKNVTAVAVQRLIDAGAVIIGKMKTSQFANGETATGDWVDYHSPFNARGDGYQDPSSSSSGPGAGIGAYTWLDLALGSDTGGSIRNPSQVNGAFGNRPSHGLVSLDGVMPLSPDLDTAGFITRDASLWKTTASALYQTNVTLDWTKFPTKLYTSGFPAKATNEAETVLLSFLSKLQAFLGASNATVLDYNALWAQSGPVSANLSTYLNTVYPALISRQQWDLVTVPFYADYAAAFQGRLPFIDPSPLIRWTYGQKNLTANATEDALARKTVFANWWNANVQVSDPETCTDSILLYPGSLATPTYRNVYRAAPGVPTGFSTSRISNFAGVPDMVIPVGEAGFNSTITGKLEYLPVTVDVMVARGCDGVVFELAEQLVGKGIVRNVGVGSSMFAAGGVDVTYM